MLGFRLCAAAGALVLAHAGCEVETSSTTLALSDDDEAEVDGDTIGDPTTVVDIATLTAGVDPLTRVSGAGVLAGPPFGVPLGILGVPVAGGEDLDGDGLADYAVAHMLSSPLGRPFTGEINLIFGNGSTANALDLAVPQTSFLRIVGSGNLGVLEQAGSEIWIGDVTGDGVSDLLICVQNFSFFDGTAVRFGAGALAVIVGGPELRGLADNLQILDLANPDPSITIFALVGGNSFDRVGIWARTGDIDGDGVTDFIVAADQESDAQATHHGAVYAVRGGAHLAQNATVDLGSFGSTLLAGHIARITPPSGSAEFHLGATSQLGDLDGNGRAEILASAALNRAGAGLGPFGPGAHGTGGPPGGRTFILWDDAFPAAPWPAGFQIDLASAPGVTTISGGVQNGTFGEELLGGLDYDGDGRAELFIGDLVGDGSELGDRPVSGVGYVFFGAERLRGLDFNIDDPPPPFDGDSDSDSDSDSDGDSDGDSDSDSDGAPLVKILGPVAGAIGSDTVAQGDFDGDGFGDLMIGSPHATPQGRVSAGAMHVLFGREDGWPELIDTAPGAFPPHGSIRITEIQGALGRTAVDEGDTLCYSAAAGDIDGDGRSDIITNEMVGNGLAPSTLDVGNLLVVGGDLISPDDDSDSDSDSD